MQRSRLRSYSLGLLVLAVAAVLLAGCNSTVPHATGSGKLRVVRVIRGLGHGLDENAIQAAQQIHFKPALRDGQPADSTAVLHIVFQLA